MVGLRREAEQQYMTTDPLKVRMETHLRFSERQLDLDAECRSTMRLTGDETVLDVGCGPGLFLSFLRDNGHRGRLVGLDRSMAMIDEASARDARMMWLVGDVLALPVDVEGVDWIVARHMLYYIDDLSAALREIKRVLGSGGQFLASTNAVQSAPMIDELYLDMLAAFGLPVTRHGGGEFHTESALTVLRGFWSEVNETLLDNAFVFTEPAPIVDYVATMLPSVEGVTGPAMREEMLDWLNREAARRLRVLGGVWRDPKVVGLYVCR